MSRQETIKNILDLLFFNPQKTLGGTEEERKLDNIHLVSIKLLSATPILGRGCKMDPVLIKIGFSNINEKEDICNLEEEEINTILESLRVFDDVIGSWTLVHDIPATSTRSQWRLSAEVSPISIFSGKIEEIKEKISEKKEEKTQNKNFKKPEKIFCIDLEGVGIFMGKPKNS